MSGIFATIVANSFAKVIKDPLEPFRKGFKDGTMWYRLVSFVKLQLRDKGFVDFHGLEKFDFHKRFKLSYLFYTELEASISIGPERTLNVIARSRCTLKLNRDKADSYQQTLIVLFLEADFTPVVISESVILPLEPVQDREQCTSWAIPNFAKTAIVALKCDFFVQGASVNRESRKGMQIMKVMDVGSA